MQGQVPSYLFLEP